jgi:hypothetical protein
MDNRIFTMAVLAWSLASTGNLPAQDNRNSHTNPPTLEDRIDQLEQDDQNLIGQVAQLRNDFADLQDRVKRLEEGKQLPQPPPPAARSEGSGRSTNSGEQQPLESATQQSYDVFYEGLQSGGHWFKDPTYGDVWQPDVATSDSNWRPYSNGHWAYTDQGWTWISNEDFGWATYHYGRWVRRSDTGWVWIPGSRWAPAWVSWRESNNDVGWAPLPPEVADDSQTRVGGWVDNYYGIGPEAYSFVKIGDLSRPTYRDVMLTPADNVELFSRTRNVTDIVYGSNVVAVNGPRYEQVAPQVKIPSYKLSYVTGNEGRYGINTRGNQLQVTGPPSKLQQSATEQPKIEKALSQTQVERGWQEIDQQKTAQLKQTMQRQAPVPADLPPQPTPPTPVMAKAQNQAPPNPPNQPLPNAPNQPPANAQSQPVSNVQNQPPPNAQGQPASNVQNQPPANSQNQPAEKARQQQTTGQPSGSEASTQGQEQSSTPQASPAPQEQPRGPRSSRAEKPAPAESSPTPRRSTEQREREREATKPAPARSEESRSHTPDMDQPPSKEEPNVRNQFPGEPTKEQLNETRRPAEARGNEPAEDRANDRASHSENQPEAKKGQRGEPQGSTEARPRAEEQHSEHANPDHDKREKQESKEPKKEEPPSEQPR